MVDIALKQVLHGRRQFVVWIVPLSGVTNETLIVCYMCHARLPPHWVWFSLLVTNEGGGRRGWRQVSMTLDISGYTRDTMGETTGRDAVMLSQSFKLFLSSDWGLQLALMKSESLVIAGQLYRGEYVLKSCTHRPSSQGSRGCPKSVHCMA